MLETGSIYRHRYNRKLYLAVTGCYLINYENGVKHEESVTESPEDRVKFEPVYRLEFKHLLAHWGAEERVEEIQHIFADKNEYVKYTKRVNPKTIIKIYKVILDGKRLS